MIAGIVHGRTSLSFNIQYARSLWIRHDWLGVYSSLLGFEVKAEHARQALSAD